MSAPKLKRGRAWRDAKRQARIIRPSAEPGIIDKIFDTLFWSTMLFCVAASFFV